MTDPKEPPVLKRISCNEVAGRTVRGIFARDYWPAMFIVFDDGTFVVVTAERDPHDGKVRVDDDPKVDVLAEISATLLVEAGVTSAEEIAAHRAQLERELEAQTEAWERALLARLAEKHKMSGQPE